MKKIIVAAMILFSTSVWGESRCRSYEYQEIKDMSDEELQLEITEIDRLALYNLKLSTKSFERGDTLEDKKAWEAYEACNDQKKRLSAIVKKRPSYVPPKKMTYEDCKKQMLELKANDDSICEKFK